MTPGSAEQGFKSTFMSDDIVADVDTIKLSSMEWLETKVRIYKRLDFE